MKEFWFCTKRMILFWECRTLVTPHSINAGFPSSRCRHTIPSEMAKPGQFQWPHLHIRWESTVTATALLTLLLSELCLPSLSVCTFQGSGPSECYFRHCLLASQAETVPFECSSTFGTFLYMFSTSAGT